MFNKKIIIVAALILAIALPAGCAVKDDRQNPDGSGIINQETGGNPTGSPEDKQKALMDEFAGLIGKDGALSDVLEFVDQNIASLSAESASDMLDRFEATQKKNLSKLEEKYYNDDMQKQLNKIYSPGFDINKIDGVSDPALKDLLTETRDGGYKVDTAEGTYYPVIHYAVYKQYGAYTTPDMKDYIDIMAVESDKAPAKDAALVIGWDEVLRRAMNQEKFIGAYPDSIKIADVKPLYQKYVTFILFGLNNTPLFSYETKTMASEARSVYEKAVAESDGSSKLLETLKTYLEVLEKNNYRLTDEVDRFRKSTAENI